MPAIIITLLIVLFSFASCNVNTNQKGNQILTVLKETCDCENIAQDISTLGITLHKHENTNIGETHTFNLTNCSNEVIENNTEHIKTTLSEKIEGFDKIARLELNYINKSEFVKTIVFKHGELESITNNSSK